MNILLAHSDRFLRSVLTMWFVSRGDAVAGVSDARGALAQLRGRVPSLLLADAGLARDGGPPLDVAVGSNPAMRRLPVLKFARPRRRPVPLADLWGEAVARVRCAGYVGAVKALC